MLPSIKVVKMHSTNFTLGNKGVKQYIEPLLAGLAMHLITGHITAYNAKLLNYPNDLLQCLTDLQFKVRY